MVKTAAQHAEFARNIEAGESIQKSMLAAGYSPKVAKKGVAGISAKMLAVLRKDSRRLIELAKSHSVQEMGQIALGRLILNCQLGRDGGVASAKTLGSYRELNYWVPDNQTGVIVLTMGEKLLEKTQAALENVTIEQTAPENPSK